MLLEQAGVTVCGQAHSAEEILKLVGACSPDVVILDIRMPPSYSDEGLSAAERIRRRHPNMGVLLLSTYAETPYAIRALGGGGGGVGYLLKDRVCDVKALTGALTRVASGRLVVDDEIIGRLLAHRRRASEVDRLSERERAVLRLMAEGRSNQGIGAELHLAPKTVENYIGGVFAKLGLPASTDDNRRVLAVLAWLRTADGTRPTSLPAIRSVAPSVPPSVAPLASPPAEASSAPPT
jgi:DNA-binding NarL/FixJ family response regulator